MRPHMTCPACGSWSSAPVCDWCDFDTRKTGPSDRSTAGPVEHHGRRAGIGEDSESRRWHPSPQAYTAARHLIRFDFREQTRLIAHLLKWIVLGTVVGLLAGGASAGFLVSLDWATNTREAHPWLLFLLPLAGFAVGLGYHYGGGTSGQGNNLIIDEIHEPRTWVPRRMAPLVYVGTVITHLFGGSAGREGTAIQMSGSLTDGFSRLARLSPEDRRLLLIAAIAGGFGAVFGVPIAGCVFGLEVQAIGRMRYDAIIPALTAPLVGDLVVHGLGVHHTPTPQLAAITITVALVAKVALAGLAFGLTSVLFSELTHGIKRVAAALVRWPPARPLIGGGLVIALTYAVGTRDYLGLSIPLITQSLAGGVGVVGLAFALKLLFTSVTLGTGFQGGEVTPLFVIGTTLGASLGHLLGVSVPLMAALGFVAVFAGATNTPLACTIMGAELFGSAPLVLLAVACVVSYVFSSHRGIYGSQRLDTAKGRDPLNSDGGRLLTLAALSRQRRPWLPNRPWPPGRSPRPITGTPSPTGRPSGLSAEPPPPN
jgi:H+/Cl- antiporter ClcA